MNDRSTTNRSMPLHPSSDHTVPRDATLRLPPTIHASGDATDLSDLLVQPMLDRDRLMDAVDRFDTLGEYRKLDAVEQVLMRRAAAFRTGVAVQRQILERARQVFDEGNLAHHSHHLAEMQTAFLSSMEGAVQYDAEWGDLLRNATVYAEQRVRGDVQTSIRAYRSLQRNYAWHRLRWVVWRFAFWIVGIVAFLVALIIAPLRAAPLVIAITAAIVVIWFLFRTLLAGFIERGLVQQRRRYLRGWARDLTAAELRLQPAMLLAVLALEQDPSAMQLHNSADIAGDAPQSPMGMNSNTTR
ncbi:MAG: hypothetical protein M3Y58_23360 [Chloroflexota bacterium]|nr:hypothetical protein [Chloroflexota bacterium]